MRCLRWDRWSIFVPAIDDRFSDIVRTAFASVLWRPTSCDSFSQSNCSPSERLDCSSQSDDHTQDGLTTGQPLWSESGRSDDHHVAPGTT